MNAAVDRSNAMQSRIGSTAHPRPRAIDQRMNPQVSPMFFRTPRSAVLVRLAAVLAVLMAFASVVQASDAPPPLVTVTVGGRSAVGYPGQVVRIRNVPTGLTRQETTPWQVLAHLDILPYHGTSQGLVSVGRQTVAGSPPIIWLSGKQGSAPASLTVTSDRFVLNPGQYTNLHVKLRLTDGSEREASTFDQGTVYLNGNPTAMTVSDDGRVTALNVTSEGTSGLITAYNGGVLSMLWIVVNPVLDKDGDGLLDAWEIENGLDPEDPTDASKDSDEDGLTALQENRLGTDPLSRDTDHDGLPDGSDAEPLAAEREAPVVSFLEPLDGAEVVPGSHIPVRVNASDNAKLARVRLYVGNDLLADFSQPPFTAEVAVPVSGSDRLTIRALAEDAAGNRKQAIIGLKVRQQAPDYLAAASVSAGPFATVVRKTDGTWWAWGLNDSSQLGAGAGASPRDPIESLPELWQAVDIRIGDGFGLARMADGTVKAWGKGDEGQLGDGTHPARRALPTAVPGLIGIVQLCAGTGHALAVDSGGSLWSWGGNALGQLGNDDLTQRDSPVKSTLTGISSADAGDGFSLALAGDGLVRAWGSNERGQSVPGGSVASVTTPSPVAGLPRIVAVAAGSAHALALDADARVWAWGDNRGGQCGLSAVASPGAPVVVDLPPIVFIAAGGYLCKRPIPAS